MLKNSIEINNLNFKYGPKTIFEDLNLNIKKGSFMTIVGSNGCGKSTLAKLISTKEDIAINDSIIVALEDIDSLLIEGTVLDNIYYYLKDYKILKKEIKEKVKDLNKIFDIESILDYSINTLSYSQKQIFLIVCTILANTNIIVFDNTFSSLDNLQKEKIFKYLKKLNREEKKTIINITNDVEDTIYGNYVTLINGGKVIFSEKTKIAMTKEKEFKKANLDLPFMASLSLKLKYYDLIDDVYLDSNKLVNELWK